MSVGSVVGYCMNDIMARDDGTAPAEAFRSANEVISAPSIWKLKADPHAEQTVGLTLRPKW